MKNWFCGINLLNQRFSTCGYGFFFLTSCDVGEAKHFNTWYFLTFVMFNAVMCFSPMLGISKRSHKCTLEQCFCIKSDIHRYLRAIEANSVIFK